MKSKFVKILARVMTFFLPIEGLDTLKILCEVSKSAGGESEVFSGFVRIPWEFLGILLGDS